jgi:membrane protein DedA with SNARE-associated domain
MHFWEMVVRGHQAISYLVIFLGMFIEPDITFLIGSLFAAEGYVNWFFLAGISLVGVFASDVLWYCFGRASQETRFGNWIYRRFEPYHVWLDENFIGRYERVVFFSRYIYFVSRLTPFLAGWHRMDIKRFLKLHVLSNSVWLLVLTSLGHSLRLAIALIGPRRVLRRVEYVFGILAVIFIGGELFLKRIFTKRITGSREE